ncbi:MAG TPA: type II toxin-antitoxin system RelE/ParE family toxin [Pirellulaceae bacterium]|nr:type II toxin-antitoxin system RelE/ParE family toxin [Pirellulaceae bacterium]
MKPATLDADAEAELDDAIAWYNRRDPGIGLELEDEVRAAISRIEQNPGIGARYRNTDYRFYRVKRFPYLIYYMEVPDKVWVTAIAHGSRRPNYWRKRKPP